MSTFRPNVSEFIRASEKLLGMNKLYDDEEEAVRDMLDRLSMMFPDEGDDAAD